ncbi:hypothetical protein H257_15019, partial [Aphanomyces astaci]
RTGGDALSRLPTTPPTEQSRPSLLAEEVTSPEPQHPIKYRPDIDRLRTLAVVSVVLFHAYRHSVEGGFTGVDVFFHRIFPALLLVFTLTLVVGCVWLLDKAVQYAYFYSHRIFPALLVVGCVWLLDKAVQSFTLVDGTPFVGNIQLLTVQQGYFDASVKENPLHPWSLGLEE